MFYTMFLVWYNLLLQASYYMKINKHCSMSFIILYNRIVYINVHHTKK
jgi:hypothetical protein